MTLVIPRANPMVRCNLYAISEQVTKQLFVLMRMVPSFHMTYHRF